MQYFKNQLYLFADMIHQNEHILKTIRPLFPTKAIIKSLQSPTLDMSVKAGLTRIFLSLFMNTEKLFLVKKPKTQRVIGESHFPCTRAPSFVSTEQLREIKEVVDAYFSEKHEVEDLSYEYLRLLSYLLNSDYLIGPVETRDEWLAELSAAYELLQKAFNFCVQRITSESDDTRDRGIRKRTTTSSLSQLHDDSDDTPVIARGKSVVAEEQLAEARNVLCKCSPAPEVHTAVSVHIWNLRFGREEEGFVSVVCQEH